MAKAKQFKGISFRAKSLLRKSEGIDVEFKRTIKAIDSTDLVAFANSESGGVILVGVKEITNEQGHQIGKPIGCDIGDAEKLQILNKALDCVPPINIEVIAENTESNPFYRVEIPHGDLKPYCTSRGTYKIREDGRVQSLLPERLLSLFLDREATEFRERFRSATTEIQSALENLRGLVQQIEQEVKVNLQNVEKTLGTTEHELFDASDKLGDLKINAETLQGQISEVDERILAILGHESIADPVTRTH